MSKPPRLRFINAYLLLLALGSSYLFYSLNSGITITNDGSHFALFDSLVTNGNPELTQVRQFAFNDSAIFEGKYYSDRNPGLALLTYVFYQATRPLESSMRPLNLDPKMAARYLPAQENKITLVMLVPALSGTLLLLGIISLCVNQGNTQSIAIITAVSLIAGTLLLRYSTLFYSHITASALLVWGLVLIFRFRQSASLPAIAGGIFLLSLAVLVEHLLILIFIPTFVYLLLCCRDDLFKPTYLLTTILAGVLPMSVLMFYNWVCFESPFSLAHFHHSTDTANHSLNSLFQFERVREVLMNLLFGAPKEEVGRQDLTGLISSSPFLLIIAVPLMVLLKNRQWPGAETMVTASAILLVMLGAASFHSPYGGWDRDYRYFLAVVPLFAPLLASGLTLVTEQTGSSLARAGKWLALIAFSYLFWVSADFQFHHVRHASQVQYLTPWINQHAALFNVSLFWIYFAAPLLLVAIAARASRSGKNH